jgi:hypothetical protein
MASLFHTQGGTRYITRVPAHNKQNTQYLPGHALESADWTRLGPRAGARAAQSPAHAGYMLRCFQDRCRVRAHAALLPDFAARPHMRGPSQRMRAARAQVLSCARPPGPRAARRARRHDLLSLVLGEARGKLEAQAAEYATDGHVLRRAAPAGALSWSMRRVCCRKQACDFACCSPCRVTAWRASCTGGDDPCGRPTPVRRSYLCCCMRASAHRSSMPPGPVVQ